MVLFLIGIWRLTEEEAEWCWRWLRKKTRRQKEAEVIPDSHSYFGVFPIAIDVFALLQILEIGKRRMIVADPKGTNHYILSLFTSGFSLDSRLDLSWEWQKNESHRFSW
ncbi:unnamed protein product [Brassica oleracea]